jgi:hypothetical protein
LGFGVVGFGLVGVGFASLTGKQGASSDMIPRLIRKE